MALLKSLEIGKLKIICNVICRVNYSKYFADKEIQRCYSVLGISEDSDQEKIRSAYLKLVKKFHPDSGTPDANPDKFHEIDRAFRILLQKKSRERWSADEVNFEVHAQVFDIKHTAPQHRQYLSYNGFGAGSPSQREKQYGKIRAIHAAENVLAHRINKAQADEKTLLDKKPLKHKIKTKYGYDRLVEDLIQEAMSKGEFDNLSGIGKPLKGHQNSNPYVDFVTHKMNQVLIDNGFTPEWITLQKEIREEKSHLEKALYADRALLGKYPFDPADEYKWEKILENSKKTADSINKKISKYNLVVPVLQKQMLLLNLDKMAENVAQYGQTKKQVEALKVPVTNDVRKDPKNVLSLIESFFIK